MTSFNISELNSLEKRYRITLVNSVAGFKSANLIGTRSAAGVENLAVFSSVIHLGSDPALIGFITRPSKVARHTYRNIIETGIFTVNHITCALRESAHQTSARYDSEISEFEACNIPQEYLNDFAAPFVRESPVRLACTLEDDIHIPANDTRMIVGRIQHIHINDGLVKADGYLDLVEAGVVAISSLDGYHAVAEPVRYAYAKPDKPVRPLSDD